MMRRTPFRVFLWLATLLAPLPVAWGQSANTQPQFHEQRDLKSLIYRRLDERVSSILKNEHYSLRLQLKTKNPDAPTKPRARIRSGSVDQNLAELPGLGFAPPVMNTGIFQSIADNNGSGQPLTITEISVFVKMGALAKNQYEEAVREALDGYLKHDYPEAKTRFEITGDKNLDNEGLFNPEKLKKAFGTLAKQALVALIAVFILIPTVLCTWLIFAIKKISKQLQTTGEQISNGLQNSGANAANESQQRQQQNSSAAQSGQTLDVEFAHNQLRQAVLDNLPTTTLLLDMYSRTFQHHEMMILLGFMPQNLRESFLEHTSSNSRERFAKYIRDHAHEALIDDTESVRKMAMIKDLIFVGSQDKEAIPLIFLRQVLNKLTNSAYADIFRQASPTQRRMLLDLIAPPKLAFLVSEKLIETATVQDAAKLTVDKMSATGLIDLIHKFAGTPTEDSQKSAWNNLLEYLPDPFIEQLSLEAPVQYESIIRESFELSCKWLERKSIPEAAEFLATVSPALAADILRNLPDIKARRIDAIKSGISEHGLHLRHELIELIENNSALAKDQHAA